MTTLQSWPCFQLTWITVGYCLTNTRVILRHILQKNSSYYLHWYQRTATSFQVMMYMRPIALRHFNVLSARHLNVLLAPHSGDKVVITVRDCFCHMSLFRVT